jgi:hypothetical protein
MDRPESRTFWTRQAAASETVNSACNFTCKNRQIREFLTRVQVIGIEHHSMGYCDSCWLEQFTLSWIYIYLAFSLLLVKILCWGMQRPNGCNCRAIPVRTTTKKLNGNLGQHFPENTPDFSGNNSIFAWRNSGQKWCSHRRVISGNCIGNKPMIKYRYFGK